MKEKVERTRKKNKKKEQENMGRNLENYKTLKQDFLSASPKLSSDMESYLAWELQYALLKR